MKTAGGRKPKPLGHSAQQPSEWRGMSEQISLDQVGCEARKLPALGEISFLTSSFIELLVTNLVLGIRLRLGLPRRFSDQPFRRTPLRDFIEGCSTRWKVTRQTGHLHQIVLNSASKWLGNTPSRGLLLAQWVMT